MISIRYLSTLGSDWLFLKESDLSSLYTLMPKLDHRKRHKKMCLNLSYSTKLTEWICFPILVGDCEHSHHFMALLPQVTVDLLSKHTLADNRKFEFVLVVVLQK